MLEFKIIQKLKPNGELLEIIKNYNYINYLDYSSIRNKKWLSRCISYLIRLFNQKNNKTFINLLKKNEITIILFQLVINMKIRLLVLRSLKVYTKMSGFK